MNDSAPLTALVAARRVVDACTNRDTQTLMNRSLGTGAGPATMVKAFHDLYGLPHPSKFTPMTKERMAFRAKLHLEEFLEYIRACGLELRIKGVQPGEGSDSLVLVDDDECLSDCTIGVYDYAGVEPNYAEIMDALGDMTYVDYGHAIELGADLDAALKEIHAANLTKLGADGQPIINGCVDYTCLAESNDALACQDPAHRIDPTLPVGKVLKGPNYIKAQIARVLGL